MAEYFGLADDEVKLFRSKKIPVKKIEKAREKVRKEAEKEIMDLKKFVIYTFAGSLPWCFVLGYIGVQLGPRWEMIKGYFHILDVIVVVGIIAFLGYIIYKYKNKVSLD